MIQQNSTQLHVVSLNIPYPPNYGGVIDIYYKLIALKHLGVNLTLHCFEYDRPSALELNTICDQVYYYHRNKTLLHFFSSLPFIVSTRKNKSLITNLQKDHAPILFEGIHCTYYLNHPKLADRIKLVRAHNIEHDYYRFLSKAESNPAIKIYHKIESVKLKSYEKILFNATKILSISPEDQTYFENKYNNSIQIPAFHPNNTFTNVIGKSNYILIHGNLSVKENEKSIIFLINHVLKKSPYEVVIAGKSPTKKLLNKIKEIQNITLKENLSDEEMHSLINNAQIILLHTYQSTGIKLKLINSLFMGRHIICNDLMVVNTGLELLCHIVNTPEEWLLKIEELMTINMTSDILDKRKELLELKYNNLQNAQKIANLI